MKRLLFLVVIAAAAWYGWKQYPNLASRRPGHEAVIENSSGTQLERVRLHVGSQGYAKEVLADGEKWVFPFKVNGDEQFTLEWQIAGRTGEQTWRGGMVSAGPMLQRHSFRIEEDNQVLYNAASKGVPGP